MDSDAFGYSQPSLFVIEERHEVRTRAASRCTPLHRLSDKHG